MSDFKAKIHKKIDFRWGSAPCRTGGLLLRGEREKMEGRVKEGERKRRGVARPLHPIFCPRTVPESKNSRPNNVKRRGCRAGCCRCVTGCKCVIRWRKHGARQGSRTFGRSGRWSNLPPFRLRLDAKTQCYSSGYRAYVRAAAVMLCFYCTQTHMKLQSEF